MTELGDRAKRILQDLGIEDDEPPPTVAYDPALVPTPDLLGPRTVDSGMTALKDRIDREISVFDIYDRFMPPEKVRARPKSTQRESIKFSCPTAAHPDRDPSAWTTDEGLWYCACGEKGDKYHIVAHGENLDIKRDFREILERVADAFGLDYTPTMPKITVIAEPAPEDIIDLTPMLPATLPVLNLNKIFPIGTFARQFLDDTSRDDPPREFYAWGALIGSGLAIGRDCWLRESPNVYGNLYVCLSGHSGSGKSRSMQALLDVIRKLPYNKETSPKGIKYVGNAGSYESLVDQFSSPIYDPVNNKTIIGYDSIRAVTKVDELGSLVGHQDRSNSLKAGLQSFYDSDLAHITSRGNRDVRAEGIFCSLLTSTQLRVVQDYVTRNDLENGFAGRIIFASGHALPRIALREFTFDPTKSFTELERLHRWASFEREVKFDSDGRKMWTEFFHDVYVPLNESHSPLFARIDLTLKKIILLLAANEHTITADANIVERALLFYDYLKFTYEEIQGAVSASAEDALVTWLETTIAAHVGRHGKGPTLRDLSKAKPPKFTPKDLEDGLARQMRLGNITLQNQETTTAGGRPTKRFWLADQLKENT